MQRQAPSKLNPQVYEEACEWFVEFRAGDVDAVARRDFDFWMRKSPEHLAAYLEIAAIWNDGESLDSRRQWTAERLIECATMECGNVLALPGASPEARSPGPYPLPPQAAHFKRARVHWVASVAAVSLLVGAVAWIALRHGPTYTTAIGERRSITLADGSIVELNARSKIEVRYSVHERTVDLLQGQALFHVQKDHARPFIVRSDSTRVRAVGTQFDVDKKSGSTIVTVVEGLVAVVREGAARLSNPVGAPGGPPRSHLSETETETETETAASLSANALGGGAGAILLGAGEQLTITAKAIEKSAHADVATATAWTQRQLVFDSASLSDVAEEFNRYNERPLIIEDPQLYDFHVSGVFSSTDPTPLIRFLRQRPGVQVIETASEIRITKK